VERVSVNGVELDCHASGAGEAVVFIHGAGFADAFLPLTSEPTMRDHYRAIRYSRRGHAGSTHMTHPVAIADHAADCRGLLAALGVEKAHVVGHSYGGCVALQLACDAPDVVLTLALFEPALLAVPSGAQFSEELAAIVERYSAGDQAGAGDAFFTLVGGPEWRGDVSRMVPGGPEQAAQDISTLFESDLPSIEDWRFGPDDAARIHQPIFFLLGTESAPLFREGRDLVHSWLPQTEDGVLDGANHLLQMQYPAQAASLLTDFLKRHRA
jgi:pimeloyl-ACP methyl ester carboxylesterase